MTITYTTKANTYKFYLKHWRIFKLVIPNA